LSRTTDTRAHCRSLLLLLTTSLPLRLQITEPEIGVFHFDIQFALVVVKTAKFGIKVLDKMLNAMKKTIALVRQSVQKNKTTC